MENISELEKEFESKSQPVSSVSEDKQKMQRTATQKKATFANGYGEPRKRKKEKKKNFSEMFGIALIVSLLVTLVIGPLIFMAGFFVAGDEEVREFFDWDSISNNTRVVESNGGIEVISTEEESAIISAVEKNDPSVVSITVTANVPQMQNFFSPFFGNPNQQGEETQRQAVGSGSGFIVSEDGLIVTNRHVIQGYEDAEYTVFTTDQDQELIAKVVAIDPTNDIALLDIEGDGFTPVSFGDSSNLQVGQTVIAIGNAVGQFQNTVSKGVISGLQREIMAGNATGTMSESLTNIIQTDAAINAGNSGGPLININGDVIGINTAKAQGGENIGFAITSAEVVRAIESYNSDGEIVDNRGFMGVQYQMVNEQLNASYDLKVDEGAVIVGNDGVVPGSPADEAGLKVGDVIIEVNGEKLTQDNDLSDVVSDKKAGDEVKVKINRDGEEIEKNVKLASRSKIGSE